MRNTCLGKEKVRTLLKDKNLKVYAAIFLFYFRSLITETTLSDLSYMTAIKYVMTIVAMLLLVWRIVIPHYLKGYYIRVFICGIVFLVSFLLCRNVEMIYVFLFVTAARELDMRKVVKEVLVITLAVILLTVIFTKCGLIEYAGVSKTGEWFQLVESGTAGGPWGFKHKNSLGCRILICFIAYTYLSFDKESVKLYKNKIGRYNKIGYYIIGILLASFCYFSIRSRTAAVTIVLTIIMILAYNLLKHVSEDKVKSYMKYTVYSVMVLSIFASLFICITYNSEKTVYYVLNKFFTGRFSLANKYFNTYGFSLFGQNVNALSEKVMLDNAYMHLMIRCGFFAALLIIGAWFLTAGNALKQQNYVVVIIVAVYFICGISENWLFNISCNPFVLLLSGAIYQQRDGKNTKKGAFMKCSSKDIKT